MKKEHRKKSKWACILLILHKVNENMQSMGSQKVRHDWVTELKQC